MMRKKKIAQIRDSENCDSDILDAVTVIDVSKYSGWGSPLSIDQE